VPAARRRCTTRRATSRPGLDADASSAPSPTGDVFRADAGLLDGVELVGSGTVPERLWHAPALAVLGMDAPSTEEASNVLLPRARAKLSLRLAPGEDEHAALELLTDHLVAHAVWGSVVEVTPGSTAGPFALEATGDVYDVARGAFAEAYGNAAVEAGIGGSIPFIAEFARAYPGGHGARDGRRRPVVALARHRREPRPRHVGARLRRRGAAAPRARAVSVEERLTRVLGSWAAASVLAGAALSTSPRTRGFGRQTVAWGAVDAAIAGWGVRGRRRRGPTEPQRLRRVLLLNAGLDVGYLGAGAWLVRDGRWRGDGLAVLVQGAFLLWLDTTAAQELA
jgi:hypothetical protein